MAKKDYKKVGEFEQKVAEVETPIQTAEVKTEETPVVANAEPKEKVVLKAKPELSEDVKATKNFAWLAYIFFFIPLLINKNSQFVRHSANEGLEINIFDLLGTILLICGVCIQTSVSTVKMFLIICTIVGLVLLILTIITKIYMIVATLRGKTVETPWFWNVKIIK